MSDPTSSWYAEGLRFACSGCGACCRIEGHVWVDQPAIRRLASHLGLDVDDFGQRYLRRVGRRYSLIEKSNHDCVFWEDGCAVYEARPSQCRSFPFWPELLESSAAWDEAGEECRGIGCGRLYEAREIEAIADDGAGVAATADGPSGGCGCNRGRAD